MAVEKKQIVKRATIPVVTPDDLPIAPADIGLIAYMGLDFEISLFAMSPNVVSLEMDQGGNTHGPANVKITPSYKTTAKLRLGAAAMAQIGTGMLKALQDVDPDAYADAINSLTGIEGNPDDAVH